MKGMGGRGEMSGKKIYRTCQARYVATTKKCGEQAGKTDYRRTRQVGEEGGGAENKNRKKGSNKRQRESDSEFQHIPCPATEFNFLIGSTFRVSDIPS